MAKKPFFEPSESERKLYESLSEEARATQRALGWTDEQIDARSRETAKKAQAKERRRNAPKKAK